MKAPRKSERAGPAVRFPQPASRPLLVRLRTLVAEGKTLLLSGLGLTAREREGVMLVAALFVLGLAVQWLRWLLGSG